MTHCNGWERQCIVVEKLDLGGHWIFPVLEDQQRQVVRKTTQTGQEDTNPQHLLDLPCGYMEISVSIVLHTDVNALLVIWPSDHLTHGQGNTCTQKPRFEEARHITVLKINLYVLLIWHIIVTYNDTYTGLMNIWNKVLFDLEPAYSVSTNCIVKKNTSKSLIHIINREQG